MVLYGPAAEAVDPARFLDPATMYSLHRVNPDGARERQRASVSARRWPSCLRHDNAIGSSEQVCSAEALCRQPLEDPAAA